MSATTAVKKAEEAKSLVEQHGGIRAAAAASGIPESTLRNRMKSAGVQATVSAGDQHRIRQLETIIEQQAEALERSRGSAFQLAAGSKKRKNKPFLRVIIPDSHGCHIDQDAASAFLTDLDMLKPAEVVMLGDHLDCGGFLAAHHTENFVAETDYTFEDDVAAANVFLDEVQKRVGKVPVHYISGNHERRVEKWILTQKLRNQSDAEYLLRLFGPATVLRLADRGIEYYSETDFHCGLVIRGTIKLGHCHFTHGSSTAKHAASAMVDKFGGNVVFGHTHRADAFVRRTVSQGAIGAWNPGCLCQLQPYYGLTNLSNWSHGYGLQIVQDDGSFLHINVPIVDGRSYMVPLVT